MAQSTGPSLPLAVQLYTVRDLVQTDMATALGQVARIGYTGVELAGYGNLREPVAVKKAVHDTGLTIAGSHAGIESLETNLDKVLDENEVLGNRTIVCPWMPEQRRQDAEGWLECAKVLNRIGAGCAARGFTFCYHHHSFEFSRFKLRATGAEKSGLQIVWENTDPALVKAELDTYWLQHGGEDPAAYIRGLGSRVELIHLKDMAAGAERRFAPVGSGTLEFSAILAAAKNAGVKWGIVEQDDCYATPPLEALRLSFENLQKMMS